MLADENTGIRMSGKKELFDEIKKKDEITMIEYPLMKSGNLSLLVHSGTLEFTIKKDGVNSTSPHLFASKESQQFEFDLSDSTVFPWQPISIESKCLVDHCVYSLKVIENKIRDKSTVREEKITPGNPIYAYISSNDIKCFVGFLNTKQEKIIISSSKEKVESMRQLDFDVKIGDLEDVKTEKMVIRNVMTVNFDLP